MADQPVCYQFSSGTLPEADFLAWCQTVQHALNVYIEKDSVRQGLWKDYSSIDQFNMVKIKSERILRSLQLLPETQGEKRAILVANILEEIADIINYSAFGWETLPE